MIIEQANYRHWRQERDPDGILWLTFDRADSGANSLSHEVLEELERLLVEVAADLPRAVVFRSGKKSGFIAGADIREFTLIKDRDEALALIRRGQEVLAR